MNSLLVINASGRVTRSITRYLTARFAAGWSSRLSGAEVLTRDIGVDPPPAVDEKWICAEFAAPMERTAEMQQSLALSELLIDELFKAEVIVLGAPMYNFGMPGQLKAYVDQIVRVGRTFTFNPVATEPYRPVAGAQASRGNHLRRRRIRSSRAERSLTSTSSNHISKRCLNSWVKDLDLCASRLR